MAVHIGEQIDQGGGDMYCPKCGAQIEEAIKFCKSCGLKVTDHARLLEAQREADSEGEQPMRREKWMVYGVVLTLVRRPTGIEM